MSRAEDISTSAREAEIQIELAASREKKVDEILAEAAQKVRGIVEPRVAALVEDRKFPVLEIGTKLGRNNQGYTVITGTDEILGVNLNAGFSGDDAIVLSPEGLYHCSTAYHGDGHGTRAPVWKDKHIASDLSWLTHAKCIVKTLSDIQRGELIPGAVKNTHRP